jgi:hypothetical protein
MEQLVMVRFFTLKGLSPRDIHNELESVYMDEAICLSTVCKWHERLMQEGTELFVDPRSGRSLENDLADALRAMIQEFPFTSYQLLCIHFRLGKATCLRILRDILRWQKFNVRWVPHSRGYTQRGERMSISKDLLRVLRENQKIGFANVMTVDESWFSIEYAHQLVSILCTDEIPGKIKQKIDTEKCLISVLLSVNWIHSLPEVPKGTLYDTTFFRDDVFGLFACKRMGTEPKTDAERNLIASWQCASPHLEEIE